MDFDTKVRKCSSCKLVLPSHLFKNEQSTFFYKTCLPCRYKKRLKYYCGERGAFFTRSDSIERSLVKTREE